MSSSGFFVVPRPLHRDLIRAAYRHRGYTAEEAEDAARFCEMASTHGIRTHNGIKALHLDEHFGSKAGGCVPGAEIEEIPSRFPASKIWNANRKLGQSTAFAAMEEAIRLADHYGIGQVSVDHAFHYLWGGGYVMDAAQRGYIAYTNCTAALAEVVPFGGKFPTLGTNPHSWGFPTTEALGYPIVIDWATSTVAMGRVQQFKREGKELPPNAAVDADGRPTTDPDKVAALVPFGAHKGYGLALINELVAGLIGGSLPTLRSRPVPEGEKRTCCFYFQVIHPDAISGGLFAEERTQQENLKAVLADVFGHGNESCTLPGQPEAQAAAAAQKAGGLLFTAAEIGEFNAIARECGLPEWQVDRFAAFAG
ncbi:MAG: malate/L-lactate dehydrogenase [Verrucomicrobiales bacterium]|nr:malate/L-lactate dehydrogenase [Verrucomicrobiales bacterium]